MECFLEYFKGEPEPTLEETLPLESLTWIEYLFGHLLCEFVSTLFGGKTQKEIPPPPEDPPTFYQKLQSCVYGDKERKYRQILAIQEFQRYRIQQTANAFLFYLICCITLMSIFVVYSIGKKRFVKFWDYYLGTNNKDKGIKSSKEKLESWKWFVTSSYKLLETDVTKKVKEAKIELNLKEQSSIRNIFDSMDRFDKFLARKMQQFEKIDRHTLVPTPSEYHRSPPKPAEQIGDCRTSQK